MMIMMMAVCVLVAMLNCLSTFFNCARYSHHMHMPLSLPLLSFYPHSQFSQSIHPLYMCNLHLSLLPCFLHVYTAFPISLHFPPCSILPSIIVSAPSSISHPFLLHHLYHPLPLFFHHSRPPSFPPLSLPPFSVSSSSDSEV